MTQRGESEKQGAGSGDARTTGYVCLAILVLLLLFSQRLALSHFWEIWESPDHYYSHGLLVPILAGIMILMNRGRLRQVAFAPSWLGLAAATLALVIQVVGAATGFEEISGFAFLIMVYGFVISLYGLKTARILFWPLLFLTTMIPLPQIVLDGITAKYQIVSSHLAANMLRLVDSSIVAHGNVIVGERLPGALLIAPACSGLRLSVALIMCAWFLLYVLEGNWQRKTALALLVLPIGALVNAGRIAMVGLAAIRSGSAQTIDSFHDTGGYIGLAACSALLLCFAWLIGFRRFRDPDAELSRGSRESRGSGGIGQIGLKVGLAVILLAAGIASGSITGIYRDLPKGRIDRTSIPASLNGWLAEPAAIDAVTLRQLAKADLLNLVYRDPDYPKQEVYVLVDNAVDISMFHDPRLCLIGAGSNVSHQRIVKLRLHGTKSSPGSQIPGWVLSIGGPEGSAWMLCVYRTPDGFLPTKDSVNAYTIRARLADLWRIGLSPASLSSVRKEARARQITWYRFVVYSDASETAPALLRGFAEDFLSEVTGERTEPPSR